MALQRLPHSRDVRIYRFADRRGSEGDKDPYRIGGFYDRFGYRVARLLATASWPEILSEALRVGFLQRGAGRVEVSDQEYGDGQALGSSGLAITGAIEHFSSEYWGGRTGKAHVAGTVRIYNGQGMLVFEKAFSARTTGKQGLFSDEMKEDEFLGRLLSDAIRGFVQGVITDPDVTKQLLEAHWRRPRLV